MSTAQRHTPETPNYWHFAAQRSQRTTWLCTLGLCLVAYAILYLCYPYPAMISDSYGYLLGAWDGTFMVYRPMGYVHFMQLIHACSKSIQAVVCAQFLCYALSCSLLIIALRCYYPLRHSWQQHLLACCIVVCPTALYMQNSIMSDSLFGSAFYLMVAMGVVMIHQRSYRALALYLLALWTLLFTRYSAMFFPLALLPVFYFLPNKVMRWGSLIGSVLIGIYFYNNISRNMAQFLGRKQFDTGFSGWQLANNAMHVLPYVDVDRYTPDDPELAQLHNFCKHHFDDVIRAKLHNGTDASALFLWDEELPLKQFLYYTMECNEHVPYITVWALLGSDYYARYGRWLICHYPAAFCKYYLANNIPGIFYPTHLEMLSSYETVAADKAEVVQWFDLDTHEPLTPRYPLYHRYMRHVLPLLELLTWVALVAFSLPLLLYWRRWTASRAAVLTWTLLVALAVIYYGTTTFASPIVIRYWMPMWGVKIALCWWAWYHLPPFFSLFKGRNPL